MVSFQDSKKKGNRHNIDRLPFFILLTFPGKNL